MWRDLLKTNSEVLAVPKHQQTTQTEEEVQQDLAWEDGKLTAATIRTAKGGTFRLYVNAALSGNITLEKGQSYSWPE
jgi:hypothetical protein